MAPGPDRAADGARHSPPPRPLARLATPTGDRPHATVTATAAAVTAAPGGRCSERRRRPARQRRRAQGALPAGPCPPNPAHRARHPPSGQIHPSPGTWPRCARAGTPSPATARTAVVGPVLGTGRARRRHRRPPPRTRHTRHPRGWRPRVVHPEPVRRKPGHRPRPRVRRRRGLRRTSAPSRPGSCPAPARPGSSPRTAWGPPASTP
ncbi:hypothetical protein LV779_32265 [Streptomyces thinghirensis]|nr:hypothetical protein [Streptomyces thinghirensis]